MTSTECWDFLTPYPTLSSKSILFVCNSPFSTDVIYGISPARNGVVLCAGGLWLPGRGHGEDGARPEDVVQGSLRRREVKGGRPN